MKPIVLQILPALEVGGVERGTLEIGKGLIKKGYGSFVVSGGGRLVNQLEKEGSEHFTVDVGKKSLLTFKHIPCLRDIIVKNNINIVHVRSRMPAWVTYFSLLSMKKESRPLFISTIHGPYSVNCYSKIMLKGRCIIAVSKFIDDYITKHYPDVDSRNVTVIHRGVSSEQYYPDFIPEKRWIESWFKEVPNAKDKIIITLPGRLTRRKGQIDFLHIIKKLMDKRIPVHGIITGEPHRRNRLFYSELKRLVKKLGVEKHVSLIGSRTDLREVMKISDVVVSLSKIPEAFGRTVLEALCLGTPVVAYNYGGASEILEVLFPYGLTKPNDIEAAATKLEEIINTKHNIKRNDVFTLDLMIKKTIDVYEKALSCTD